MRRDAPGSRWVFRARCAVIVQMVHPGYSLGQPGDSSAGRSAEMTTKERVDVLLVARGLAESRAVAQRLVMAGQVRVEGQVVHKPSQRLETNASLTVDHGPRFVSRGGEKLLAAFEVFPVSVEGKVCADVGASTGGFTDCLLQHGAAKVYAIDVGRGILHWKLRHDPRVVLMERTNARHLEALPEPVDFVTIDVSFISLRRIFPSVAGWLDSKAEVVALVKPQFEAGRESVRKGGVVRDPQARRRALENVMACAASFGLNPQGLMPSPLLGPKGNVEFLLWCRRGGAMVQASELLEPFFEVDGA